ncbi:hypothetical protein ASE92_00255 [Pedobacter sp. Leaf41]|uniref:nuclear transport factor 2 family protein n=1 Tax=Pedobacter sp. Leaf41 TaxID=1736218 RepID=UPI000702CC99|nr:nuclear transport factor 2 family protein [Pedobacter sp. Leaf41]KQN37916.1 hypothetical protein ASE92_00255 [Pedobacter sp. Leaf41]
MKRYAFLAVLLSFICTSAFAQSDENAIKQTVNNLFTGMKNGDSTLARSAFAKDCMMQTVVNKNSITSAPTEKLDGFIKFIGCPHKEKFD